MRILIVANGSPPSARLLETLRAQADLTIATDGAAEVLRSLGSGADVVMGDFDSLSSEILEQMDPSILKPAPDQNASDLEKAVVWALQRGAQTVTITGATGRRLDHTLTNMSILVKYAGEPIRIVEDWGDARAVVGEATVEGTPGDTLSLILFAPAKGVTLTGVRWALDGESLSPGSRGVSNEFTEPAARIRVAQGTLLALHLHRVTGDGRS
ncbi:MAG: thiamine diphosphokinase [Chthonomonadales bacterium]